jgi:hypothetical protein
MVTLWRKCAGVWSWRGEHCTVLTGFQIIETLRLPLSESPDHYPTSPGGQGKGNLCDGGEDMLFISCYSYMMTCRQTCATGEKTSGPVAPTNAKYRE